MNAFPGYRQLIGPEQLGWEQLRVTSPVEYFRWQQVVCQVRHGQVWDSPEPAGAAYVNEGRWVATCFWCHHGMLTRPDWGVACCGECGARYRAGQVTFPADWPAIAAVLCVRPSRATQHWGVHPDVPGSRAQSVDELRRENREELGIAC